LVDAFWFGDDMTLALAEHTQVSPLNMLDCLYLIELQTEVRYVRLSPHALAATQ
jgi:hypothetical protein